MAEPALNGLDALPGIALVPAPVESLGRHPELDDEVPGEVLGLDFSAFLVPEAEEGSFVAAHDDPGVGAADKSPSIGIEIHARFLAMSIIDESI